MMLDGMIFLSNSAKILACTVLAVFIDKVYSCLDFLRLSGLFVLRGERKFFKGTPERVVGTVPVGLKLRFLGLVGVVGCFGER